MSITAEPGQDFFSDDTYFRTHPLAAPSFLIQEPIDRLTEDEVPMNELEDADWLEEQAQACACCGWVRWWRNPECAQAQPPEFVIDDARPGVLRAPRPDDFAQVDPRAV